jgi:UDP-N-acetylmuramate: L-alanyl-gamma-D-glutamyl-meso-diaminopimelate ligase
VLDSFKHVHFIGICGTAMAAVAAAMKSRGHTVTGSDRNVYPPMSTFLEDQGIQVRVGYDESHVADSPDLVVVGNAVSRGNPEVEAVLNRKLRYCSLPELLKEGFIRGKRALVVCGTHGKTTTTALLAWVFEHNKLNPNYLIGGIANNFGQGARFTDSEWFIIEGDEYDTAFFDKRSKFVHYLPEVAIINNLEFDHADIFADLSAIQTSFQRLINVVPGNGLLLVNGDDANIAPLLDVKHCPVKRFGIGPENDLRCEASAFDESGSSFTLGSFRFRIPMIGELYVRNAMAVIACARHAGLTDEQIQSAFDTFKGIRRRQEVSGEVRGITVIDDFGHHPTAIRETLKALRHRYAGRRLWALFEPRSNTTRRKVFQNELVSALTEADQIVVAQVARLDQLPEEDRLDPARLMTDIAAAGRAAAYLEDVEQIVRHVASEAVAGDVVCVFSNGGFDGIHKKLLARLSTEPLSA